MQLFSIVFLSIEVVLLVLVGVAVSTALYSASDDVIELTPKNFDSLVINSQEIWVVEFYAPW